MSVWTRCRSAAGALASTTYPIDRDFVREQLGFARLTDELPSTAYPTATTVSSCSPRCPS